MSRRTQSLLDQLARSADGLFALDDAMRIITWSPAAERTLGLRPEQVLGRPCYEVFDGRTEWGEPRCRPGCLLFENARRKKAVPAHDIFVTRRDGSHARINLSVLPVDQMEGAAVAVLFREIRPLALGSSVDVPLGAAREQPAVEAALLRVHLLGPFRLFTERGPVTDRRLARPKVRMVLKYLAAHRRRVVPRDVLIDLLWLEAGLEAGARNLKVLMHTLRRALGAALLTGGPELAQFRDGGYLLDPHGVVWFDADEFLRRLHAARSLQRAGDLARAAAEYRASEELYSGDYLESDLYEDWAAAERERLRELYQLAVTELAGLLAGGGEYQSAIHYCRRALARDPYREGVHRALMRYLWWTGQGAEALRQFERCRALLTREMGIDPLPETVALARRIRRDLAESGPRGRRG